mmetsp:Transcript_39847/g.96159  ORF Transcript_39847/g.96159 Transcript_39847/m.96159 type:complete len:213 (-) Transcript_39847:190-828(-)
MVGDVVLGDVIECILQSPVRQWVALGKTTTDGCILEQVDPCTFESLPPCTSVDHTVRVQCLQSTLERFDLTDTVILFDVLLPKVSSIPLVVCSLVSNGDTLSTEDLGLEVIKVFNFFQEIHSFGEQVEGIDDHDFAFSVLEVPHPMQQVCNDDITRDHGIGENSIVEVFTTDLQGVHGLFLQMFETHLFRFSNELFLIERRSSSICCDRQSR